jgi:hypothetical protein
VSRVRVASTVLFLAGALAVAKTQRQLAQTVHAIKERDEVYALPPPAELHAATLGWDAAAVDLLWAKLLVEYGVHWSEHREFLAVPSYADAILALEPDYAPLYKYLDTMLAYRPLQGTEDDVRMARAYLERGTRERPYDAAIWSQYGQFVAFIAPSFLRDEADRGQWRRDGATALGHAVELGARADSALAVASVLSRGGRAREAIRYLERAYSFTADPSMQEIHEKIGRQLASLEVTAMRDAADATARAIDARWQDELPYVTRGQYLLLGPKVDRARCAGLAASGDPACGRNFVSVDPSESSAGSP